MRRYISSSLLMCALSFSGGATAADDPKLAEARLRFTEGLKLSDAGKYEEARLKHLQALEKKTLPSILFNLALAEEKTGHEVEAVEHAREFLKVAPFDPRYGDAELAPAKDKLAELLNRVGQIEVQAPRDARLAVDGRELREFPKDPVPVTPGTHTVTATFNSKVKTVTVAPAAGQSVKATFDFGTEATREALPQPSDKGKEEPAGMEERSTLGWVVPIGLGVVGLGGIVMGAGFASAANGTKDDVDRQATAGLCTARGAPACGAYDDKISTMTSQTTLSWVGYAVGGAALAASIVTFVVWPKSRNASPKTGGMTLVPIADGHRAGATLDVRF